MKKKAFLYAYDKVNLGDDLFVRTLVNRYPHVHFYMWSDARNKENFSDLNNLTVIDKNATIFKLLSKIRPSLVVRYQEILKNKCDIVVYIGGSIFMEYPNWKDIVNWWNYQAEHHKFYVLGANFGPYQTEEYRRAMDEVFSKLQDVCFRDQYSYDLFKDNEKVRMAPDILFSLSENHKMEKKKEVMFSLISCEKKEDGKLSYCKKNYMSLVLSFAKEYMNKGYHVVFVSFCEMEGDFEAVREIVDSLQESYSQGNYEIISYDGKNYNEILSKIKVAECIIATRFHAIILGLAFGATVIPVIYSDKTKNVLQDMGINDTFWDVRDANVKLDSIKKIDGRKTELMDDLKNKALMHFDKIDQILS